MDEHIDDIKTREVDTRDLIQATDFCINHHIDISFIHMIQENGWIEIISIDEKFYIQPGQLQLLERIMRLHYELNINPEGIETAINLLERIEDLQREINILRNRLRFYENID